MFVYKINTVPLKVVQDILRLPHGAGCNLNLICFKSDPAPSCSPYWQHHTTKCKQTNKQTSLVRVVRDKIQIDPAPLQMAQDVT